jgi:hypothetical protein
MTGFWAVASVRDGMQSKGSNVAAGSGTMLLALPPPTLWCNWTLSPRHWFLHTHTWCRCNSDTHFTPHISIIPHLRYICVMPRVTASHWRDVRRILGLQPTKNLSHLKNEVCLCVCMCLCACVCLGFVLTSPMDWSLACCYVGPPNI